MAIRAFVNHTNADTTIPLLKNAPFFVSEPNLVDLIHDLHEPRSKGVLCLRVIYSVHIGSNCLACQTASNKYWKFHFQNVRTNRDNTIYARDSYNRYECKVKTVE